MYNLLRYLLFALPPETSHALTLHAVRAAGSMPPGRWLLRALFAPTAEPRLQVTAFGLHFPNPLGLAAGYDKNGLAVDGLSALGFGHLELGTVTPAAQPGNPKPRLFRLRQDDALINRMGFPNRGAAFLARRLQRRSQSSTHQTVVGVNIGKGRDVPIDRAADEYALALRTVYPVADYVAINVSSPNTPGLRGLQARDALAALLDRLAAERATLQATHTRRVPLLIKLSPDLSPQELDDVIEVARARKMDGAIAVNTTLAREDLRSPAAGEAGGLSGRPLAARSMQVIRHVYRASGGEWPIIGVGGVALADDAVEHILAGASLVQVYTGLVYRGPGLVRAVCRRLQQAVETHGVGSVADLVGRSS